MYLFYPFDIPRRFLQFCCQQTFQMIGWKWGKIECENFSFSKHNFRRFSHSYYRKSKYLKFCCHIHFINNTKYEKFEFGNIQKVEQIFPHDSVYISKIIFKILDLPYIFFNINVKNLWKLNILDGKIDYFWPKIR